MLGKNVAKDVIQGYRLSPQQERLWFLERSAQALPGAHCVVRLDGRLDPLLLKTAIQYVIQRHEILRTTFSQLPEMTFPVQVIAETDSVAQDTYDLRHLSSCEQEAKIQALLSHRIDVKSDSMTCCTLVRLGHATQVLLLTVPTCCADVLTLDNLVRQICRAYTASLLGESVPDDDVLQYADFAEWQHALLEDDIEGSGHAYWRKQMQSISPLSESKLPFEQVPIAPPVFIAKQLPLVISHELVERIDQVAIRYGVTSSTFLLACWGIVLQRLTGQEDVLIGVGCDGRTHEDMADALGPFARYLPVIYKPVQDRGFGTILEPLQQAILETKEWQDYFNWAAAQESSGSASERFFPYCFEFNDALLSCSAPDLSFTIEHRNAYIDRFKVRFVCERKGTTIDAAVHYDAALYEEATIACLAEQLVTLVEHAVHQPDTMIGSLEMLSEAQRHQVLSLFNDTGVVHQQDLYLHQLFEVQVNRTPDNIALVYENHSLTYRELNHRADRLAHLLRSRGVGLETPVAICMERSPELIVGLLAILKAGGAYVPIDPSYPKDRIHYVLEDSRAPLLLTQLKFQDEFPDSTAAILIVDEEQQVPEGTARLTPLVPRTQDAVAYMIYTSGSTGRPKGVLVSHRNAVHSTLARFNYYTDPVSSFLLLSSFAFDSSVAGIFWTLGQGGKLCLIREGSQKDPAELGEVIARQQVSHLLCLPSLFFLLLEHVPHGQLRSLRAAIVAGETCPRELVARHHAHLSQTQLFNEYGPTEGTVWSSVYQSPGPDGSSVVPIGRSIATMQIYLLDARLQPVPIGIPGELHIAGVGLTRGYHNRPELTAEKFIPNPFSEELGGRLYRTGDVARYGPDGNIEFIGRLDQQVKLRGYRIELGEIETRLIEHPAIEDVVVLARESNSGDKQLVAYVVAKGTAPESASLREFLKTRLPEYMLPSAFVFLKAFPLTPNGKVDRKALPEPDLAGRLATQFVAPRTATEEILVGLWSEVLKVPQVGVHDNFFDLGGHSLLATQVMSRLPKLLRVELPLRTLFEAPTVAQLAGVVETRTGRAYEKEADSIPLLPVKRGGSLPLSFAQQRLWVLAQLEPHGTAYNIPIALRVLGALNLPVLEQSINEVVHRHEMLRTTFGAVEGKAIQIPASSLKVPLPVIDLQHLSFVEREAAVLRLATAEAQRVFELEYGPMLRMSLLQLGQDEHILLVTLHHIVSDAWSAHVLVREVTALYTAFAAGRPSPLQPLTIQYADFAAWQRQWLSGDVLEKELRYWKDRLKGDLPVLALPTDHLRPAVQTFNGASISHKVSSALMLRIKELSRTEGVTLFMTLLAAWYLLLNRYTGQNDILVGSPIANRTRQEIEGLIGFFVNTLVLRVDLSGNPTVKEFLERVRTLCLDAYSHQDVPFEKLVEVLQPARDVSYSPLFQVMFDLQNAPVSDMDIPGLRIMPVEIENKTSKVDLSLSIQEGGQELTVSIDYNTDLFEAQTIERMLGHFQTLLESMVAEPEACVSKLSFLTTDERNTVVTGWNETAMAYPEIGWLPEAIAAQAARTPEARAVTLDDHTLTYAELLARATQLAQQLRQQGVGPDMLVGVAMERSLELVVALLGILQAGGAYLPLDPDYPAERLAFMLADARPVLLLTQASLRARFPTYSGPMWCLDTDELPISGQPATALDVAFHGTHLAYTIYTSGSTGQPKGVGNTHAGLLNRLQWMQTQYRLTPMDRVLQKTPFSFDVSVWEFFWPLLVGAELVLAQPGEHRDGLRLLDRIIRHQITTLHFVPPMLDAFLETPGLERCGSLRRVFCSGEALPAAVARRCLDTFPQAELHNLYGPTEAAIDVTAWACRPADCERGLPIGHPIANTQLYLLDPDGQPVPIGVPGELYIGGIGVARGYHGRPALTAEKFVPNPFGTEPGDRLYRTGDRARARPDGAFEYLGRFDHQVKLRGFRIELGEIEARLMQHQTVRDAVVLLREDSPGLKRLVAYVTAHEGQAVDTAAVRTWLQVGLPEYMVPALILPLEDLPLTPNGKVDRKALPIPDFTDRLAHQYVEPRTPTEQRLTEIWAEVLGVQRVGIHDNFFDLGGHSLLAVQVMTRIRETMEGIRGQFPLIAVFQFPTVAALAEALTRSSEDASSPLVAFRTGGSNPPLYCMDPTGTHVRAYQPLAHALRDDQPVYGLSLSSLFAMDWRDVSVAAIAKEYVALIRQCQPAGSPFHLLGWSNGGVIALAMAHELERQGESVAFLGILDTQPRVEVYSRDVLSDTDEMLAYIRSDRREDFLRIAEEERSALERHLQGLPDDERVDYAIRWAKDKHLLSEEEAHSSMEMLKLGYALDKAGALFMREYANQRIEAPVHAWWSSKTLHRVGSAPIEWRMYTTGLVEQYTVIGEHSDVVQSIQVHQKIDEILSRLHGEHYQSR